MAESVRVEPSAGVVALTSAVPHEPVSKLPGTRMYQASRAWISHPEPRENLTRRVEPLKCDPQTCLTKGLSGGRLDVCRHLLLQ